MAESGKPAPVGVGLIGYGLAGSALHGPLIETEPRLRLQVVASRHPGRVSAHVPGVRVVATPAELLEDPAVDLVVVAAPSATHYELTTQTLRAGRHVVVEKPLAARASEGRSGRRCPAR